MLGLTWVQLAIAVVVFAAIAAVVYVALKRLGMMPPEWAVHILWIVVVAVVAVLAILVLAELWSAAGRRG